MAFEELKQMQGVMWGEGNFDEVADSIEDVHQAVADALAPDKAEEFRQANIAYSEEAREGDHIAERREYLLITGTRAAA
jgi:hypothetical protein